MEMTPNSICEVPGCVVVHAIVAEELVRPLVVGAPARLSGTRVGVAVLVGVRVLVAVTRGVGVRVRVAVGVGVRVGVRLAVAVGVGVGVLVMVGVSVGVDVWVEVGLLDEVSVGSTNAAEAVPALRSTAP